jgi:hypothetical protein
MCQVRLMTWNLGEPLLPGQDGSPDTEAAFQAKLASLAAVIDQVTPDIAAVQEIGPDLALARLQERLTHQLPHAATAIPTTARYIYRKLGVSSRGQAIHHAQQLGLLPA